MGSGIVATPWLDTILRLGLAALLGGLIGLDREAGGKPAGFRTNILICVGAATLTLLSIEVAERWVATHGTVADPGRIAAQIVSGIGFLGAGSIIQSRHGVRGLTTAATIWVVAAIGMAVGGGAIVLALVATAGVLLTLVLLSRIEDWLEPRMRDDRSVRIWVHPAGKDTHRTVIGMLRARDVSIRTVDVDQRGDTVELAFRARARNRDWDDILDTILATEHVVRASLE